MVTRAKHKPRVLSPQHESLVEFWTDDRLIQRETQNLWNPLTNRCPRSPELSTRQIESLTIVISVIGEQMEMFNLEFNAVHVTKGHL